MILLLLTIAKASAFVLNPLKAEDEVKLDGAEFELIMVIMFFLSLFPKATKTFESNVVMSEQTVSMS